MRIVLATLIGLLAFAFLAFAVGFAAKSVWPAYAAAVPSRAYSVTMLLMRLLAGALIAAAAGWITAAFAGGAEKAWLSLAGLLLCTSALWHIRIWPDYPIWYHLAWLDCLVPAVWLGARLQTHSSP